MTTQVHLTLTPQQAQAVIDACDLYTRMGLGQLEEIARLVSWGAIRPAGGGIATGQLRDSIEELMMQAKKVLCHPRSGSFGIGHSFVPVNAKRAYEVEKVLDKALSEHREPNPRLRGCNYDGLIVRYTSDPVPVAQVKEQA
jgi:hypothetical protein